MTTTNYAGPQGLGGWLILLAIGQTLGPLRLLADLWEVLGFYGKVKASVFYIEVALSVAFLAFWVFVTVAMYQQRRTFPMLWTYQFLIGLLLPWANILILAALMNHPAAMLVDGAVIGQSIGVAIVGGLWVWYLRVSTRVKNTFVT